MKNQLAQIQRRWHLLAGTTLLLALPAVSQAQSDASEIGRVFYTPQERLALEQYGIRTEVPTGPAEKTKDKSLRFNGVLRGQDGGIKAWVNGQPLDRKSSPAWRPEIMLRGTDLVVVRNGSRTILQAGETLGEDPMPSMRTPLIELRKP